MAKARHRRWRYNRRSKLAAATVGTDRYGYAYDTIGNRLWSAANAVTNSYTANSLNQYTTVGRAVPSAPDSALVYDADGNLTNDGIFSYSYDAENRLVAAYPLSSVVGSLAVLNRYDHRHRRVQKIVKQYDGMTWETTETHTFIWDGNNIVLEKIALAGGTTRMCEYFWGADKSGTEQGAGGVGGLLYVKHNDAIYVPHADAMGNILRYTDTAGNVVAAYTYDAFGKTISATGSLAHLFRFRFSTKYYDQGTGLYYYGYRFYSPSLMRWINRDPIEEKGSVNIYAFCANNPIANYDSDGRAYFAVRKLKNCPLIVKWSWFVSNPFAKVAVDVAADYLNVEILHEQLFFEDGGKDLENVGWGTDKDGKETYLRNEPKDGYTARDGGYDDCIMRLAVGKVNPDHYQLTWIGKKTKCNCQDYASALRAKYRELENDLEVKCKCKKGK